MKKIVFAATAALITVAATATPAMAAPGNTSTATGTATATIIAPIVLTHPTTAALNFGRFTRGNGDTVTVSAAGARSAGGEVNLVTGSTATADRFTVAGDGSRTFSIATTGGSVTSGATSLSFTTTPSSASGTLSAAGAASFTVGGTLTITATAPAGAYTGSYTARVTYN